MMMSRLRTCLFTGLAAFVSLCVATDVEAQVSLDQGNQLNQLQPGLTTIQLPTFNFTTVTTTVSVPDGGTVLLGGVKRLREGRNGGGPGGFLLGGGSSGGPPPGNGATGVPILNKVPYINRLFKNVGIGRETQSLMLMVTPRIIIQEEE